MECPHCKHKTDDTALLQCSHCGEAFERSLLEEAQHLTYLHKWLGERTGLEQKTRVALLAVAEARLQVVLAQMLPKTAESIPVEDLKPQPALPVEVVTPKVAVPATASVPTQPKLAPVAAPQPAPAPKPSAPPKPKTPPMDWVKVRQQLTDFVTSGALLRALLYLGAFMIVISATVLVVRFWNNFHPILQIGFIAAVPAGFYAGGWLLRTRLKIVQAGTVLTGVGAILVAVDFAAVYQFTGLAGNVNGPAYWLVAALVCTALYTFTAWRLPGEFFDYITLISGGSILFVLTRLFNTPLEWSVDAVTLAGAAMAFIAARFKSAPGLIGDLAKAARYLAQIVIPISVVFVMFSNRALPVGQMLGFVFAMCGYALLAWRFPALVFAYLALGTSLGAVYFLLRVIELPLTWYTTAAGALAFVYILISEFFKRADATAVMNRHYRNALIGTTFVLILVSSLGGLGSLSIEYWRGVIALAVAAFDIAVCAYLFRHSGLTFIAAGFFIFPFSLAAGRLLNDADIAQATAWFSVTWGGLALAYISLAALLRKAEYHALWLYVWAHILTPLGLFVLWITHEPGHSNIPELSALGLASIIYLATFILQDGHQHPAFAPLEKWIPLGRSFFLWPLGIILPILGAVAWRGSVLDWAWFGAALAGGAIVYVAAGQGLAQRLKEYCLPFHLYAYILSLIGIIVAAPMHMALLVASALVVVALAALAYLYNRVFETALAAMLFVLPFTLALRELNILLYAYNLGYVLLAALIYIPLAVYLNKFEKSRTAWHPVPLFGVGYVLTAYAVIISVVSRAWDSYLPWVGVAVPLVATALLIYSTYYFKSSTLRLLWTWTPVLTFALAFGQALTFFKVPAVYAALAWAGLALGYMLIERGFKRSNLRWLDLFHWPLIAGALIGAALALSLSYEESILAISGFGTGHAIAPMLAQFVVVLLAIGAAGLHRTRWPLFLEPLLAFVPATLFFIAYGENIFGQALTTPQFALVWTGLGLIHLIAAALLDRAKVRYSHGLYFGGYIILLFALLWSVSERVTNILTLAAVILLALASYVLFHIGRHHSFEDFIRFFWRKTDSVPQQIASTGFLFIAAYLIPVLLTQTMAHYDLERAWRGFALAAAAPLYIAFGFALRRVKVRSTLNPVPTWAMYSAGYALTAIGAMVAFENERLATVALALNAVVYAVSAYIFQQVFWLYLTTVLAPVIALLILHQTDHLNPIWTAWTFSAFGFVYLGMGQLFDRLKKPASENIHSFAMPFYAPGFVLSAVALAFGSDNKDLALQVYSAGVVFYALSGFIFREPLFIYPAAWLAAIPYYLAVTAFKLEVQWYGLAWLPLIVLYIALGRFVFHRRPLAPLGQGMLFQWLLHPAVPLYVMAYALSVSTIILSAVTPLTLTLAFGAGALLYIGSAFLFRQPGWLYASLFAAHMTLLTYFTLNPSGGKAYYLSIPFTIVAWLMALIGAAVKRFVPQEKTYRWALLDHLLGHRWARPFFVFAFADILIWQSIALYGYDTTIIVALSHLALFTLFSLLWMSGALVYGAVGFGLLALGAALKQMGLPFATGVAVFSGIGLGLYLLARILEALSARIRAFSVWLQPLTNLSIGLTALAGLIDLFFVNGQPTATAAALAFAGALYVAIAYRGRKYALGYLGMALLEVAWVVVLYMNDISQPQFYAIPGGLYFLGVSFLEARRDRKRYALALELLGLGVLLLPTFIQSLSRENGLPYFILFLAEGFIVLAWGVLRRRKSPFFAGIGAVALNILAQLILLMQIYNIVRWIVALAVGLLIMLLAIFVERRREQIRARMGEFGETLEKWD